ADARSASGCSCRRWRSALPPASRTRRTRTRATAPSSDPPRPTRRRPRRSGRTRPEAGGPWSSSPGSQQRVSCSFLLSFQLNAPTFDSRTTLGAQRTSVASTPRRPGHRANRAEKPNGQSQDPDPPSLARFGETETFFRGPCCAGPSQARHGATAGYSRAQHGFPAVSAPGARVRALRLGKFRVRDDGDGRVLPRVPEAVLERGDGPNGEHV